MRENEGPLLSFICSDSGLRWAINPQDNCPPARWEMSSLCSVQANVYASQMKVESRDTEEECGWRDKQKSQSWTDMISNGSGSLTEAKLSLIVIFFYYFVMFRMNCEVTNHVPIKPDDSGWIQ